MSNATETFYFDGIEAETPNALLLRVDDESTWFPRSVIAEIDEDGGEAEVELWFLEKKDLI